MYKSFFDKLSNIIPLVIVSGKPPLLVIITAQPQLDASKDVLPKGSCHLEQTTAILVFLKIFITSLCFLNPFMSNLLCLKINFSLSSSPITIAFHSLCLFNTSIIVEPNTSYPFALFSLPTNVIIFSLFLNLTFCTSAL